jgi:hypothetical protein
MAAITNFLKTRGGVIAFSIVLGLGIAALFRSVCSDGKCVVIEGPSLEEVKKYYYKVEDQCYKYNPVAAECKND